MLNLSVRNVPKNYAVFRSEVVVNKVVACLGNNTTNVDGTLGEVTL